MAQLPILEYHLPESATPARRRYTHLKQIHLPGGETDPIDSLLLCQKAVNEISNAGPPTSKSVFWRRRDSRKDILSSPY